MRELYTVINLAERIVQWTNLVITQSQIHQETIVFQHIFPQFLNTRLVLIRDVAFHKTFIEFDHLS